MRKRRLQLHVGLVVICLAVPAGAEEPTGSSALVGPVVEAAEQFQLDLAQALRNRRSAPAELSAGIVTTASIEEVFDTGALTLSDYLATVPGFTHVQSHWYAWPVARGFTSASKLTIDGVSVTSPLDYRYTSGPGLFLDEFDSLEVISGPAGVQWGSYSFLGTVNLLTGASLTQGTRLRLNVGERDYMSGSARHDMTVAGGSLRLFAGYAGLRDAAVTPEVVWRGVVPYARAWRVEPLNRSTAAEVDRFAVLSARYVKGDWSAYLRLPVGYDAYQQTEFGDVLDPGAGGSRRTFDGFGYLTFNRALLDGRAGVLARASWLMLDERFDRRYLSSVDGNTYGAGVVQESRVSVVTTLLDISYRLRGAWFHSSFLVGGEGVLEIPHYSRVSQSVRELDGLRYPMGESFRTEQALLGSVYAFNESGFFQRLSAAAGVRHSFGGGLYKDTQLFLANLAFRLFADTNVKFSVTEGIRPPQILDRQGLWPVRGRVGLSPEKARSVQGEINTSWENLGPVERVMARANYGVTTTSDNILREASTYVPFEQRPVSAAGYLIQSLDATLDVALRPLGVRLAALYSLNEVFDVRSRASDRVTQQLAADNPLCGLGECVNRGPRHRIIGRLGARLAPGLWVQGSVEVQCAVKWLNTGALVAGARGERPRVEDPKEVEASGCYPLTSVSARYPSEPSDVQLVVGVNNLTGTQPPPAAFYLPELSGAEPAMPQAQGRLVYLSLRINLASQEN